MNARDSASCVFERLADLGEFARDGEFQCAASDDSAAPSGMDHKSGEVRTDTQTRVRFHRDEIQNAGFHGSSPAENASQGSVHNRSLASGIIDIGTGYAQNARNNSVHGTIGSKRAATFPSDSMVGQRRLGSNHQELAPGNPGTRLDHSLIGLVGISGGDAGIVTRVPRDRAHLVHRCVYSWVGSSIARPQYQWPVVRKLNVRTTSIFLKWRRFSMPSKVSSTAYTTVWSA